MRLDTSNFTVVSKMESRLPMTRFERPAAGEPSSLRSTDSPGRFRSATAWPSSRGSSGVFSSEAWCRAWIHLGAEAGLTEADFERVRAGPDAAGWTARQATLLRAAGELHADRVVSCPPGTSSRPTSATRDLIESCLLVGHQEILAMTLTTLGVQPERVDRAPSRLVQLVSGHGRRS